jgi:DNA-binding response OmpR family regulator
MVQTKSQAPGDSGATVAPRSDRLKVVVLDDEPTVRAVLCRFLHEHGYQPLEAKSPAAAAELLGSTFVIAVILDVRLSGGRSGLDVLSELRRQPAFSTLPAIVMTGAPLTDEEQEVVSEHHAYLFYKPEGLTALIGFLKQITDRAQPE